MGRNNWADNQEKKLDQLHLFKERKKMRKTKRSKMKKRGMMAFFSQKSKFGTNVGS